MLLYTGVFLLPSEHHWFCEPLLLPSPTQQSLFLFCHVCCQLSNGFMNVSLWPLIWWLNWSCFYNLFLVTCWKVAHTWLVPWPLHPFSSWKSTCLSPPSPFTLIFLSVIYMSASVLHRWYALVAWHFFDLSSPVRLEDVRTEMSIIVGFRMLREAGLLSGTYQNPVLLHLYNWSH